MLQLESISDIYSFHSYEKNLIRIIVPVNLHQQTETENQFSNKGASSSDSTNDSSIRELSSTTFVYQDQLNTRQFPGTFSDFDEYCLEHLLQYNADIYLIGTGESAKFPSRSIHQQIYTRKLAIEFMGTGAACRTYNILTGEKRKVAALIFMDV
jgi:uncharacterized protein